MISSIKNKEAIMRNVLLRLLYGMAIAGAASAVPLDDLRFQKTLAFAQKIQAAMREPKSLVWEDIVANDDASVICMRYRARNGFGGISREVAIYAAGRASQAVSAWNKHCAREPLNDMISVRHAL
jgi:hypothetical protein